MPRAKRYIVPGHTYHVTHRCHDRDFLLRFQKDRTAYTRLLREHLLNSPVSLFSYCVTSNHIHLLLRPEPSNALESLSQLMQVVEGEFARRYNRRKHRTNAFWGDRYHATMIESGEHLWRCLLYIDLNLVRAGAVRHPREWAWTGYQELTGLRTRYRMIDRERLLRHVGAASLESFRTNYDICVDQAIKQGDLRREAEWTEALAVGSQRYVQEVGKMIDHRMSVTIEPTDQEQGRWMVREKPGMGDADYSYSAFSAPKSSAKQVNPAKEHS